MMIILHDLGILDFRLLLIFGVIIGILSKMEVILLLIHKVVLLASSNLLRYYAQYEESSQVPYTKLNHNKNKFYLDSMSLSSIDQNLLFSHNLSYQLIYSTALDPDIVHFSNVYVVSLTKSV